MTVLLRTGNRSIRWTQPGYADDFARSDGLVGGDWEDAADTWPTSFSPATIDDNKLSLVADEPDTYGGDPNDLVGHWLIAQETGLSDDFEVALRWVIAGFDFTCQPMPCAFVDINSADPGEMGLGPLWDVSILSGATYVQNVFRNDEGNVKDPDDYDLLGGSQGQLPIVVPGINWIRMRVESGMISYTWNGVPRGTPFAVPAFATGRTMMGIQVIGFDWATTYPAFFGGGPVTAPTPCVIDQWWARPL